MRARVVGRCGWSCDGGDSSGAGRPPSASSPGRPHRRWRRRTPPPAATPGRSVRSPPPPPWWAGRRSGLPPAAPPGWPGQGAPAGGQARPRTGPGSLRYGRWPRLGQAPRSSLHASSFRLRLAGGVGEATFRHGPRVGRARRAALMCFNRHRAGWLAPIPLIRGLRGGPGTGIHSKRRHARDATRRASLLASSRNHREPYPTPVPRSNARPEVLT